MNCHNSNNYGSCESEFDSVSIPIAKKVDATIGIGSDVYVIEADNLDLDALEQTVTRLCGVTQESWDYSGVFYTNCFRASKPIRLTSVGFFGPSLPKGYKERVTYVVDIQIEEFRQNAGPTSSNNSKCGGSGSKERSMRFIINVSRTETIFYVNFPVPVNILPSVWYSIKFRLEGPETFRGTQPLDRVFAKDGIAFDFFQGSLQMPQFKYTHNVCRNSI